MSKDTASEYDDSIYYDDEYWNTAKEWLECRPDISQALEFVRNADVLLCNISDMLHLPTQSVQTAGDDTLPENYCEFFIATVHKLNELGLARKLDTIPMTWNTALGWSEIYPGLTKFKSLGSKMHTESKNHKRTPKRLYVGHKDFEYLNIYHKSVVETILGKVL